MFVVSKAISKHIFLTENICILNLFFTEVYFLSFSLWLVGIGLGDGLEMAGFPRGPYYLEKSLILIMGP